MKKIKVRMSQKHDTEANWLKVPTFIPSDGELIIYDPDDNNKYPRMKVGDNKTTIVNLPFISGAGEILYNEDGEKIFLM